MRGLQTHPTRDASRIPVISISIFLRHYYFIFYLYFIHILHSTILSGKQRARDTSGASRAAFNNTWHIFILRGFSLKMPIFNRA
jgi:hypothetical protein